MMTATITIVIALILFVLLATIVLALENSQPVSYADAQT